MTAGFAVGDRVVLGMGVDAWCDMVGTVLDPSLVRLSEEYLSGGPVTLILSDDGVEIWGYTRNATLIKAASP